VSRPFRVKAHSLGSILVEAGVVTEEQIEAGLEHRQKTGCRIGEALVQLGIVTEVDLGWALARQLGLPFVDLDPTALDQSLIQSFPEGMLRRLQAVPLLKAERNLSVAMADPTDAEAVRELVQAARCPLTPSVATPSAIENALSAVLGAPPEAMVPPVAGAPITHGVEWDRSGATYLLFHLSTAMRAGASELHFIPHGTELGVFHRTDGGLVQAATEAYEVMFSLLARIESLGGPSIDERVPHAFGQILCPLGEQELPVDVSLLNVDGGIAVTLGVRPIMTKPLALDELGFAPEVVARVRELLERPSGLILISGPVRSGCSTTLDCLLGAVAPSRRTLLIETRPGPRLDLPSRVSLDLERARELWGDIATSQNADVVGLGDVLRGSQLPAILSAAGSGRLLIASTDALDSFALIEQLASNPHARATLARRLHLVVQQRRVRVKPAESRKKGGAGAVEWMPLFETLFVTDPMRVAIAAGDGPERLRRVADADGFRSLEDLARELRKTGRLEDRESDRILS
jgi:MSHA biogenesis protein MshE